jgi:hypothetical protein
VDVPPLKYLTLGGDCIPIIEFELFCICHIGPSRPVAVDRVGLLQVRVEGTGARVRTLGDFSCCRPKLTPSSCSFVDEFAALPPCFQACCHPSALFVGRAGGQGSVLSCGSTACGPLLFSSFELDAIVLWVRRKCHFAAPAAATLPWRTYETQMPSWHLL